MIQHPDDATVQRMIDGDLSPAELAAFDEHIDRCADCRQLVAALKAAQSEGEQLAGASVATIVDSADTTNTDARSARREAVLSAGVGVDHFVVQQLIGRGGMGEVYLARDSKLDRDVALKLISSRFVDSPAAVARFQDEARTTARFSHPNIVAIHAVGEHEGQPYMALEYLPGQTLGTLMARTEPSVARTVELGLPIAEALSEAHGRSVLHRDLKPSNVVIADDGRLRVLDFGLSKALSRARQPTPAEQNQALMDHAPSGCFGTPTYMAPEQWRQEQVSSASDVWALGMILYQLATGYRPYDELPTVRTLMVEVMSPSQVLPVSSATRVALPDALAELIDRCVDKDPSVRPSAAQVAQLLRELPPAQTESAGEPAATGEPAQASAADDASAPGSHVPVAGPPGRRSRVFAWLGLGLLVGLLGVAALGIVASEPPDAGSASAGIAGRSASGSGSGSAASLVLPPGAKPLRYGIFPSAKRRTVRRELAPLFARLERALRRPIRVVIPASYGALRHALLAGKIDFATLPPLQYVLARAARPRLRALAAHRYEGASQGYLVARAASSVRTVSDLRGKRVCYVEKGSTSGYLLARRFLRAQRLDPQRLFSHARFSGTHRQVLRDLVDGRCDVGAVYSEAYLRADRFGLSRSKLNLVALTGTLPPDLVVAAPGLDGATASRLERALLSFVVRRQDGRKTLSEIYPFTIIGFAAARPRRYRAIAEAARAEGLR